MPGHPPSIGHLKGLVAAGRLCRPEAVPLGGGTYRLRHVRPSSRVGPGDPPTIRHRAEGPGRRGSAVARAGCREFRSRVRKQPPATARLSHVDGAWIRSREEWGVSSASRYATGLGEPQDLIRLTGTESLAWQAIGTSSLQTRHLAQAALTLTVRPAYWPHGRLCQSFV